MGTVTQFHSITACAANNVCRICKVKYACFRVKLLVQVILQQGPAGLTELKRLALVGIEQKKLHIWDPIACTNGLLNL